MIALIVTLACLPLLVIDALSGSTPSDASEMATVAAAPEPSLVVAASPSTEAPTSSLVAATTVPPTVAPPPTTVKRVVPAQVSPTTTKAPAPRVTSPPMTQSDEQFLACVRHRESRGNYSAADPTGTFLGAYQIYQGGWDSVAASVGRHDLVGVPPNLASPADQDEIARAMLASHGRRPWGGSCS